MENWYLLYHQERRFPSILKELDKAEVVHYMPVKECFVPRSDRKCLRKAQPRPLFPCYMFVYFDVEVIHTSTISAIDGAICFVRSGGLPYQVPEKIVSELKSYPFKVINISDEYFETRNASPLIFNKVAAIYEQPDRQARVSELLALLELPDYSLALTG